MPARVSTTRRGALTGALGGALGLVALTACDVDDLRPPEDQADPVPSPTPGATETPEPDADVQLAEDIGVQIAATLAVLSKVRGTWPRLRGQLQPLARMHRAHAEVLPGDFSGPLPPTMLIGTPAEALRSVRDAEAALHGGLVAAAVQAQSGALARLLASMSASVSQHVTALEGAA